MIRIVSMACAEALDNRTYRLRLRSLLYDGRVDWKMVKWQSDLDVAMQCRHFFPSENIAILLSLQKFTREREILQTHKFSAM